MRIFAATDNNLEQMKDFMLHQAMIGNTLCSEGFIQFLSEDIADIPLVNQWNIDNFLLVVESLVSEARLAADLYDLDEELQEVIDHIDVQPRIELS